MIDTIKLGNQGISKVYLGDQLLSALYLGTQLLYSNPVVTPVQHKLSVIVTGLTDSYDLYVNGEKLSSHDLFFNDNIILDNVAVNSDNWTITPLEYDNVIMSQDRTLVYSGATFIIPDAPTNGIVDDDANTFAFTLNPNYPNLNQYEYSVDGGNTIISTPANPFSVGNFAIPIGNVRVRVKAVANVSLASLWLSNDTAYTASSDTLLPGATRIVLPSDKFVQEGNNYRQTTNDSIVDTGLKMLGDGLAAAIIGSPAASNGTSFYLTTTPDFNGQYAGWYYDGGRIYAETNAANTEVSGWVVGQYIGLRRNGGDLQLIYGNDENSFITLYDFGAVANTFLITEPTFVGGYIYDPQGIGLSDA